jgi:hypothetical protein
MEQNATSIGDRKTALPSKRFYPALLRAVMGAYFRWWVWIKNGGSFELFESVELA